MNDITLPRSVVEQALEAFTRGCPPDCKDGMTDSGGVYPWGEPALIRCPACRAFDALRAALERPQSVTDCHQSQPQGEPPGSTESAYQRGYLDGMAKGRRDAAMDAEEGQEPVTARHRFRNPQRGTPDWSVWQPCKVEKKRPVWEIDSQGFEVEYQALYTHPQPKREPLTDAQINDHRLALPYDGEDLPDPWDFKQGVRAAERAHRIGGGA